VLKTENFPYILEILIIVTLLFKQR